MKENIAGFVIRVTVNGKVHKKSVYRIEFFHSLNRTKYPSLPAAKTMAILKWYQQNNVKLSEKIRSFGRMSCLAEAIWPDYELSINSVANNVEVWNSKGIQRDFLLSTQGRDYELHTSYNNECQNNKKFVKT